MPDLEHDMEDLFRKAAENYTLKGGDNNWESVSEKIAESKKGTESAQLLQTGRRKYINLIFLLLGLIIGWLVFRNTNYQEKIYSSAKNKIIPATSNIEKPSRQNAKGNESNAFNNSNQNKKHNFFISKSGKMLSRFISGVSYEIDDQLEKPVGINSKRYKNIKNSIALNAYLDQQIVLSKISNSNPEYISNNVTDTSENRLDKNNRSRKKDETIKKGKSNIIYKRGTYIGLVGALDFSDIKSMPGKRAGYGLGILLGYKFNRKVSLETGLIANKKNYYSEGRYFNMDRLKSTMPTGMQMKSLNTNSSILEIPVKIKYDFITRNKSIMYVSGGISAYIMTMEKNNYQAILNGNEEQFSGIYRKNEYGLPAVANISFGYQHLVSKFLNLRIEPFLKIPLKGMGMGNLPITSAGIQLSIIHSVN
ncbi:MAG: PorT family protein [Bacteroidota bacterium]|nr:PorT family protein [Bacteroidota bacterium]